MRVDFTPLYRSTIGFDRLANLLETVTQFDPTTPAYPPYNIEQVNENDYRITMAVAGFGEGDLGVEVKEGVLTITGKRLAPGLARLGNGEVACGLQPVNTTRGLLDLLRVAMHVSLD